MKKSDSTYERKLRKNRIAERKKRREAQNISEKFCQLREHEKKVAMQPVTSLIKKEIKKYRLQRMADWIKGAPERRRLNRENHLIELREKYKDEIDEFKKKNNFTKDSIVEYNSKAKSFKVLKGTTKNRSKLKV